MSDSGFWVLRTPGNAYIQTSEPTLVNQHEVKGAKILASGLSFNGAKAYILDQQKEARHQKARRRS